MRTLKIIALGTLFSFVGTLIYLYFALVHGEPVVRNEAIGLSVLFAALKGYILLNPFYWFGILFAFGLAFWLVRRWRRA